MTATVQELSSYFSSIQAKLLGADGLGLLRGGWIPLSVVNASTFEISENGAAYASASTFTVRGDITHLVQLGTRVKFTQSSTVKYYTVASASYSAGTGLTTITVVVNTDYTVANSAISDVYFSQDLAPLGFPARFEYASTQGGFGTPSNSAYYGYNITPDGIVTVEVAQINAGTSNSTSFTMTAPIAARVLTNGFWGTVPYSATDNGAALTTPTQAVIQSGSTSIVLAANISGAGGGWTNANGKAASFQLRYPAR